MAKNRNVPIKPNYYMQADQISRDMRELYEKTKKNPDTLSLASELANIAGKNLKACSIQLAWDTFIGKLGRGREVTQNLLDTMIDK